MVTELPLEVSAELSAEPRPAEKIPAEKIPEKGEKVVLVTGLSGAGKSTVLHVFEDLRLFTADGVPPSLAPEMVRLMHGSSRKDARGMALGFDQRSENFTCELESALRQLTAKGIRPVLLYLEAEKTELMRRYATTRRPHPLEREGIGLEQAVCEEAERLAGPRELADLIINTTDYSIHDLRRVIQRRWNRNTPERLHAIKVNLISFGFKYGVPREADLVFDLRFLPNPYFVEALRPLTGKDKSVAAHVFSEPSAKAFRKHFIEFLTFVLPLYDAEGRYRITIALGCTGGKHRSVAMTELLQRSLKRQDYAVSVEHRHMELG